MTLVGLDVTMMKAMLVAMPAGPARIQGFMPMSMARAMMRGMTTAPVTLLEEKKILSSSTMPMTARTRRTGCTERLNKNLTTNRFNTAKAYFMKDLGLANTPMAKDTKFIVSNTVSENWEGLYMLLNDSNLKNKAQIVKDLQNAPNLQKREAVLESYIKTVPELKDVILPTLRRA